MDAETVQTRTAPRSKCACNARAPAQVTQDGSAANPLQAAPAEEREVAAIVAFAARYYSGMPFEVRAMGAPLVHSVRSADRRRRFAAALCTAEPCCSPQSSMCLCAASSSMTPKPG